MSDWPGDSPLSILLLSTPLKSVRMRRYFFEITHFMFLATVEKRRIVTTFVDSFASSVLRLGIVGHGWMVTFRYYNATLWMECDTAL
jgi:hypothetical protein